MTVLDTHDGIGVIDVGADQAAMGRPGLLTPTQLDALVERIHENSGGTSRLATGASASNPDLYQVNCTFFDALGGDENAYLIARAIQFFMPGIPQVYYVGALAGHNDTELLGRTNVGRDINRRYYTPDEVAAEVTRPVVAALFALCAFRSKLPVFDGEFAFATGADTSELSMKWSEGESWAVLEVNLARREASISWSHDGAEGRTTDLLASPPSLH
jgi:sucrose phosphorylase